MLNRNEGMPEIEKEPENHFESYLGEDKIIQESAELLEARKQRLAKLNQAYYQLREYLVPNMYHGSMAEFADAEDGARKEIKNAKPGEKPELRRDQEVFAIINDKYREIIEGRGDISAKNKNKNKGSETASDSGSEKTDLEKIIAEIEKI